MTDLFLCYNTLKKCQYGYGVFASKDIKKGDIIEIGVMYPVFNVDGNENPHLFTWSEDKTKWAGGSGLLPFYNYSDNPNAEKERDLENYTLKVKAKRDIKLGEEITTTYFSKKWRKCFTDF